MPVTGPARRLVAVAAVLLHVVVVGLLPLGDARAEGLALGTTPHVSAPGDDGCGQAHHDVLCGLLATVRDPFTAAPAPAVPPVLMAARWSAAVPAPHAPHTALSMARAAARGPPPS